jgi:TonB family protein
LVNDFLSLVVNNWKHNNDPDPFVKTVLSTSLLAAALLAASPSTPAAAADQPAAAKPAPAPGPVVGAMQSALRELQLAQDPRQPLPAQLDRIAAMRYSPETAAKLRAVFGNEQPFTVARQSAKPGRLAYQARLQPLHYAGEDGSRVDWDEALLDLDMDEAGKTVDFKGQWNSLSAVEPVMRLSAEGIRLAGRQSRSRDRLWFGEGELQVASVRGEGKPGEPVLAMDDLRMTWRSTDRAKTVDMQFQQRIGSLSAAGEKVEDIHFDMRLVNIDRGSMLALQAASERQHDELAAMTPEQQMAAMKPMLLGFGKAAIARGSAIEIDEISARYRGNKASIRGRVGLLGAVEADLQDIGKLMKKIVARFEIRVPVAMVRDIAGAIATRQGQPAMSQTMADVMIGKVVGGGFARIENDVLVSKLEFRNGKLSANGKEIVLPTAAPAGAPPVASQRSNLPPGALQARRVEDSCRLPDYPDEVVKKNQPLRASFAYRVDTEGNVRDARVAAPSRAPAWDRAALEALAQCRYIPALQDGKPIEVQMSWSIMRAAGSKHPNSAP